LNIVTNKGVLIEMAKLHSFACGDFRVGSCEQANVCNVQDVFKNAKGRIFISFNSVVISFQFFYSLSSCLSVLA